MTDDPTTAPFGSWRSPLDAAGATAGSTTLTDLQVDGDDLYWIEGRPEAGGRQVVVRWDGATTTDVTPSEANVRTRVHEYGGGAFAVHDGVLFASHWDDQRVYRYEVGGDGPARPITPEPPSPAALRYADGVVTPGGRWLVCVRETHGDDEPVNEIVAVPTDGTSEPRVLVAGRDFVAAPRVSRDGGRLAWLAWDHPDMPWDGAELWVGSLTGDLELTDGRHVAGGDEVSVCQAEWDRDGSLVFSSDRSGFWNLYRADARGEDTVQITDLEADLGHPLWQFGASAFAFVGREILAAAVDAGVSRLLRIGPGGDVDDLGVDFTRMARVRGTPAGVALVGASPDRAAAIATVDPEGHVTVIREVELEALPATHRPGAEPLDFPTPDGARSHAFLYRPHNPDYRGPDDERPPLLVLTHGGPTGHVSPVLDVDIAFWTTRGFAVVDVNYRGSTGYGRAYRDALGGNWGVHDVVDAIAAARYLARTGQVDGGRMAIRGGSAGGFTTLAALVSGEDVFAAGASYFGVADLGALARETHKFESRYLDRLVGPYPEAEALYEERSPISNVDRLRTPLLVLQGDEDEIVPPAQAEAIVEAARAAGIPHAYLLFEGEQHGFRKREHQIRALEAELSFYGQVMGFVPADDLPPLELRTG